MAFLHKWYGLSERILHSLLQPVIENFLSFHFFWNNQSFNLSKRYIRNQSHLHPKTYPISPKTIFVIISSPLRNQSQLVRVASTATKRIGLLENHLQQSDLQSTTRRTKTTMSGQREPVWQSDKPLALQLNKFAARTAQHFAQGTFSPSEKPTNELPKLFKPVQLPILKNLILKNAAIVSPMCMYSSQDGFPTPFHLAHLGSFALHGAGTIMVEASGVTPQGRITPQDLGIWKDEHTAAHASLVSALKSFSKDLTVGIQIAHAGRKASTWSPYDEGKKQNATYVTKEEGGWPEEVIAPSALAYGKGWIVPKALTTEEVQSIEKAFVDAADRAYKAGYDFVELHSAHGYLLHEFLSPLSNQRTDQYGGSFENRTRLHRDIIEKIHKAHPDLSIWVRVSGTDFADHLKEEGKQPWDVEGTKEFAKLLSTLPVDVLDISGGGLVEEQKIKPVPGYQVPFAKSVSQLNLQSPLIATVGRMESGEHIGELAEKALQEDDASLILIARGFLTKPNWVEEAAEQLLGTETAKNPQYHRALSIKEVKRSKRD